MWTGSVIVISGSSECDVPSGSAQHWCDPRLFALCVEISEIPRIHSGSHPSWPSPTWTSRPTWFRLHLKTKTLLLLLYWDFKSAPCDLWDHKFTLTYQILTSITPSVGSFIKMIGSFCSCQENNCSDVMLISCTGTPDWSLEKNQCFGTKGSNSVLTGSHDRFK